MTKEQWQITGRHVSYPVYTPNTTKLGVYSSVLAGSGKIGPKELKARTGSVSVSALTWAGIEWWINGSILNPKMPRVFEGSRRGFFGGCNVFLLLFFSNYHGYQDICWQNEAHYTVGLFIHSQIARFMGPIWGPPGPNVGHMNLAIRVWTWVYESLCY